MFACPIITHEPFDLFASNFDWGTRENHGNVLGLVLSLGKINGFLVLLNKPIYDVCVGQLLNLWLDRWCRGTTVQCSRTDKPVCTLYIVHFWLTTINYTTRISASANWQVETYACIFSNLFFLNVSELLIICKCFFRIYFKLKSEAIKSMLIRNIRKIPYIRRPPLPHLYIPSKAIASGSLSPVNHSIVSRYWKNLHYGGRRGERRTRNNLGEWSNCWNSTKVQLFNKKFRI